MLSRFCPPRTHVATAPRLTAPAPGRLLLIVACAAVSLATPARGESKNLSKDSEHDSLGTDPEAAARSGGLAPELVGLAPPALPPGDAVPSGDLATAPQVPAAATFSVRASIETSEARLFLGDVATCSGEPTICAEAGAIDLGPSPEPGRTVVWHSDRLLGVLSKEWPGAYLNLTGPKLIKLTALSQPLEDDRVAAALSAALKTMLDGDTDHAITFDKLSLGAGIKLRPGEYQLRFPTLTAEHGADLGWLLRNLTSYQRVPVVCRPRVSSELTAAGGPSEGGAADEDDNADDDADQPSQPAASAKDGASCAFTVSAQFILQAKLPVARHSLAKGDRIEAEDLHLSWISIDPGHAHFEADISKLIGRRLRHALEPGKPLLASDSELGRVIQRGQLATLSMKSDGLDVASQVRVLANGFPGQTIDAVMPSNKKKIKVRVVDGTTVEFVHAN